MKNLAYKLWYLGDTRSKGVYLVTGIVQRRGIKKIFELKSPELKDISVKHEVSRVARKIALNLTKINDVTPKLSSNVIFSPVAMNFYEAYFTYKVALAREILKIVFSFF